MKLTMHEDFDRDAVVEECHRLEEAIRKSNSEYLKRDYGKRLRKLRRVLLATV